MWSEGRLCGMVGYNRLDWDNRTAFIGYWLAKDAEGKGIVTRCCRALVDHAFTELGLNRVVIQVAVGNFRSQAIPDRLGFSREGIAREGEWLYDRYVDLAVNALLRTAFAPETPPAAQDSRPLPGDAPSDKAGSRLTVHMVASLDGYVARKDVGHRTEALVMDASLDQQIQDFLKLHKLHEFHTFMEGAEECSPDHVFTLLSDNTSKFITYQTDDGMQRQCSWWHSQMRNVPSDAASMKAAVWATLLRQEDIIFHRDDGSGETFPLSLPAMRLRPVAVDF
jgi:hypothetical protein